MPDIEITEASETSEELAEAFARLIPQLSSSSAPPTREQLAGMISSPAVTVLVARDGSDGPIMGTLTLAVFPIPTAVRAWIEDVVVDGEARGRGVGEALTLEAIRRAGRAGAKTVDLTSRPSRRAANQLYQRLGFELRQTNVYRFDTAQ
ncbi:MAG: GNAT family N-acetyltransferase [Acidimicrobiales bacterium]